MRRFRPFSFLGSGFSRVGARVRESIFLKVYITLLACLAAVAMASAIYWSSSMDRDKLDWRKRFEHFVGRMVPLNNNPAELRQMVERLGEALDTDIGLYGIDGMLIASSGKAPPQVGGRDGAMQIRLRDGRVLVVGLDPFGGGSRKRVLPYLLLIATVVGAAGYPVVRNLTRRLEQLRTGVEKFGSGSLSARVPVRGGDEIAIVAKSFNAAAARIEQLVNAHRSLLANASHELRSPLARLRMAVDLHGEGVTDQRQEIVTNLKEIDELVEEILLASRLDHVGKLEKTERLDLTALVAEECARHGVEAAGQVTEVNGDAKLLRRLVRNLLLNAGRHGRPPVEAEVQADGKLVRLSVRDHGDGLPKGEETRVFEAFYRPSGRSEASGGWGLGLALVKQIAELHGGNVRYEAPADGGARFVIELPRAV